MKKTTILLLSLILAAGIAGCDSNKANNTPVANTDTDVTETEVVADPVTKIILGSNITIDGEGASLSENGVSITSAGTYEISGTLADGSIKIDAADQEVELILNGAHITSTDGPAILFTNTKEALVTMQEGTNNTLTDGGESEYDAALYSTSSLTIKGGGNLTITGNNNEGIATEMHLNIEDGNVHVTAVDDGLNANNDNVSTITVSGGYLYIESGGDGVDSNGTINITGGTVISLSALTDASGGLDADGEVTISGGTVIATGAKLSVPSSNSSQKSLFVSYDTAQKADTLVSIQNEGNDILTFAPAKDYQALLYSSSEITEGTTYDIYSGGSATGDLIDGLYSNATYTQGTKIASVTTDSINQANQQDGPPGQPMGDTQQGEAPGTPPTGGQEPPQDNTKGNTQANTQGNKQGTPPTGSPAQGNSNNQGNTQAGSNGEAPPSKPQGTPNQGEGEPPTPPEGEPGDKPQGDPPGEPPSGERPEPPANSQGTTTNNSST
ncbi:hypothetical protein D3C81_1026000 [compost metagenome]